MEMAVLLTQTTDLVGWLSCRVDEHTQHKLMDSLDALHMQDEGGGEKGSAVMHVMQKCDACWLDLGHASMH